MSATATQTSSTSTLDRLLKKVASVKAGSKHENIPPSSHPTDDLDGGNRAPTKGVTATEQKPVVAEAAQSNPIDGSKLTEGNGDKEHGLRRMLAEDKPQVSPKMADKDPMKLASLSTRDLIAKAAAAVTPVAAQLLVDAAKDAAGSVSADPKTAETLKVAGENTTTTTTTTPAVTTPPVDAEALAKAAKEGAEAADRAAKKYIATTIKQANMAADLLAQFTKLSQAEQEKQVEEANLKKKAEMDGGMPPPAAGGAGPMPPVAAPTDSGGGAPPAPPGGDGAGPDAPADPHAMTAGADGKLSDQQIEQLLMALLEQQGSADPKALEEASDPAAKMIGKQAREFLKQGKFQIRPVKDAKSRTAIDQMKQYVRETTR